ncbi:hypothetical protein [Oceanobacillus kimchii]|nr:hypothetical protein [Oceanobacillus kimchii]
MNNIILLLPFVVSFVKLIIRYLLQENAAVVNIRFHPVHLMIRS